MTFELCPFSGHHQPRSCPSTLGAPPRGATSGGSAGFALLLSLSTQLAACGDSSGTGGSGGGGTLPAAGVCEYRVSGDTNDIVKERGEFHFNGSTLVGSCLRDSDNGVALVGSIELKAYEGPGQTVTIDESEAWGTVDFNGNDGWRYAILFDPPNGRPPAECTLSVIEGPTEAAPNELVKVSFECAHIYGLDASGISTDTREVQVTEGNWEATTFE